MERKVGKKELILLLALFVVLGGVYLWYTFSEKESGSSVQVTVDGEVLGVYDLYKNQEIPITIDGEVANVLVIKDGVADMISANCPDQICVDTAAISARGETIVCLPHKVVVEVLTSEVEAEFDVVQ